jgi:TRAP transporter TAXI family solute receptor
MLNKPYRTLLPLLAAAIALAGGVGHSVAQERQSLVVGTAPAGSASFPYQIGVSEVVNKYVPTLVLSPQETGGSVANIRLLDEDKIQLSGFSAAVAADAVKGTGPFEETRKVSVLFNMYQHGFIWFGTKSSGVASWNDAKGKTIIAGTPGGSTRVVGSLVAEITGMAEADVKFLPPDAMLSALRDNTAAAGYGLITGAAVAPWVTEAKATLDLNFFGADEATVAKATETNPGLSAAKYPAGFIEGQGAIETVGEYLVMGASPDLSEDAAYEIVKAVFEHYDELANFTPTVKGASPESMAIALPQGVNYHPGAVRFFKEKGLLQ